MTFPLYPSTTRANSCLPWVRSLSERRRQVGSTLWKVKLTNCRLGGCSGLAITVLLETFSLGVSRQKMSTFSIISPPVCQPEPPAMVDRWEGIWYPLTSMGTKALAMLPFFLLPWAFPAAAIEVQPGPEQVRTALERGKAAAVARVPPDQLYAWFGSADDLAPRGFLMTKIVGLTVMSAHFALRAATPSEPEIRQVLDDTSLLISVVLFGGRPDFARDSYMLLVQGERTIKPVKVRFDGQAARSSAWPQAPAYKAKVVASFSYADLDPKAQTKISVFPAGGGEVAFDVDFSAIE